MRPPYFFLVGASLVAAGCSSDPVFTESAGTGAHGGNSGTGANGGSGASSQGGDGTGANNAGGGAAGGDPAGGGPVGGSTGTGGQGTGGAVMPICGDGIINGTDECDDGNQFDKDGCAACVVDCPLNGYKDPATNHCYFVAEGFHGTWQGAETACTTTTPGTTLAALSTEAEYNLLLGEVANDDQWIGGHDQNVDGDYEWTNGEPWIYVDGAFPWAANQPNDDNVPADQDCIGLDPYNGSLGLYDRKCSDASDALCERVPLGQ